MRIKSTSLSKSDSVINKIGKLVVSEPSEVEAAGLSVLATELGAGRLLSWATLMWALQNNKISKRNTETLEAIVSKHEKSFLDDKQAREGA